MKIKQEINQKEITPAKTMIALFEIGWAAKPLSLPISSSSLTKAPNGKRLIE
jgi:hypothetical protein